MEFKPFFINSNIPDCYEDIKSYNKLMESCAGNTGNSYITYALIKELFGSFKKINHIKNIYTYDFEKSNLDIDFINNECTHVFLILQDQIRLGESYGLKLPYGKIQNFVNKLNKPVIIAGLGANSFTEYKSDFYKNLPNDLVDFLKFLSEHTINIGIRGYYTQEILHNLGIDNTTVIGCPSFYENGKNRVLTKKNQISRDRILFSSQYDANSLYNFTNNVLQDKYEEKYIKPIAFNEFSDEYSYTEFRKLYNEQYRIFSNMEDWKNFVSNYDFVIGTRVHGSIISINAGVVPVCCNGDLRAKEMCEYMKIPNIICVDDSYNLENLYAEIDIDLMNKAYPKLYAGYQEFLNKNNLVLKELIATEESVEMPHLKLYDRFYFYNFAISKINKMFNDKILSKFKKEKYAKNQ